MNLLYIILLGHFTGDFLLQPRVLARDKSHITWALLIHTFIYSATLFYTIWLLSFRDIALPAFLYSLVNGMTHFAIDGVTSRISKFYWLRSQENVKKDSVLSKELAEDDEHKFWVTIGADQLLHAWVLIYSLRILG